MTTVVRFLTIISVLVLINGGNAAESSTAQQMFGLGWDALKGFGEIITKALLHMVLWGIFGLIMGVVAGIFLWRILRDRGWMDVPWGWYKYVRWMWPVLIVATLSLGLGSTLATWGSGRTFKKASREGEVIEKAVFNTYAMVMVWRLDPKGLGVNGTALMEKDFASGLAKLKDTVGKFTEVEEQTREKAIKEMENKVGGGKMRKTVYREILSFIWDQQIKSEITNNEAAEFLSDALQAEKSGSAEAAVIAVRKKIMDGMYKAVDESVNSVTYPIISAVLLAMALVLLVPLVPFWLVRWLWLKKYPVTMAVDQMKNQGEELPFDEVH